MFSARCSMTSAAWSSSDGDCTWTVIKILVTSLFTMSSNWRNSSKASLVFLLGLLLRVAAQMDALAQVIKCAEMVTPVRVEGLQQHHTLKLREVLLAHQLHLGVERIVSGLNHLFQNFIIGDRLGSLDLLLQREGN